MKTAKKILSIALTVTAAVAVLYAIFGVISILRAPFTSFPWWSALAYAAVIFGPLLALEAIALLVLHIKTKKQA